MRKHRRPRFVELSRNKRADMAFEMKHLILKDAYDKFYTHHVLYGENSWADVIFLGRDKATFYNATIVSPADKRGEILWDLAWEAAEALVPVEEQGDVDFKDFLQRSRIPVAEFEDRTRVEYVSHLVDKWKADETLVPVHAMAEIDNDYVFGIGLHVVLDEPFVTEESINRFIDRFRANGELAYYKDDPVSFEVINKPVQLGNMMNI